MPFLHVMRRAVARAVGAFVLGAGLLAAGSSGAVAQTNENVYITNFTDGTVSTIDVDTNAVIGTPIKVGAGPTGLALSPDGGTLFVVNQIDETISIVSLPSGNPVVAPIVLPKGSSPRNITLTPNGAKAYVTDFGNGTVTVIDTASGTILGAPIPIGIHPEWITITPDGTTVYVASNGDGALWEISTATDQVAEAPLPLGDGLEGIAISGDGVVVYISSDNGVIYAVNTGPEDVTGIIPAGSHPGQMALGIFDELAITSGFNGTVEVADIDALQIEIPPVAIGNNPQGVAIVDIQGDDSNQEVAYIANFGGNTIQAFDALAGQTIGAPIAVGAGPIGVVIGAKPSPLEAAVLPGSRSFQVGTTATVFATMLNNGTQDLNDCGIFLLSPSPDALTLDFQTTDATTNALTGQEDEFVTIPAGGSQSFVLFFNASAPFTAPALPLGFGCDQVGQAAVVPGVNTVDLLASATPIPDIIALSATKSNNGVATIPIGGTGAFAVASINIGSAASITVSADTGNADLPVTALICQTDPNGACQAAPAATVTLAYATNATPTFSLFLTTSAPVAFDPAVNRLFVRFTDSSGVLHGSTSVALQTD